MKLYKCQKWANLTSEDMKVKFKITESYNTTK